MASHTYLKRDPSSTATALVWLLLKYCNKSVWKEQSRLMKNVVKSSETLCKNSTISVTNLQTLRKLKCTLCSSL